MRDRCLKDSATRPRTSANSKWTKRSSNLSRRLTTARLPSPTASTYSVRAGISGAPHGRLQQRSLHSRRECPAARNGETCGPAEASFLAAAMAAIARTERGDNSSPSIQRVMQEEIEEFFRGGARDRARAAHRLEPARRPSGRRRRRLRAPAT
jgi:hypothetical protein